ncbi:MAG: serine hydrolase [Coriobacteriales bacterium]|jgi:beta-lactamase class A|nr:serine hydrolase [Coriobacteriales bacterium]
MFCRNCGHTIEESHRVCPHCQKSVNADNADGAATTESALAATDGLAAAVAAIRFAATPTTEPEPAAAVVTTEPESAAVAAIEPVTTPTDEPFAVAAADVSVAPAAQQARTTAASPSLPQAPTYMPPAAFTSPTYEPASASAPAAKPPRNKFLIPVICVVAVLLIAGGVAVGILVGSQQQAQPSTNGQVVEQEASQNEESSNTREDEEKEAPEVAVEETPKVRLDPGELDAIISNSGAPGNLGVAVFDLTDGQTYLSANAQNQYQASALIDIPIYYTLHKERLAGNLSFSDTITFRHSVSGRGVLTAAQDGEQMNISSLLDTMFRYSDNNATNTLIDYLGLDKINRVCNESGYTSVQLERPIVLGETTRDNYLSAFDLAAMLNEVYADESDRRFLESHFFLDDSLARRGLGAAVSSSDMFMNLNGFTTDKYNEVAIVARPTGGSTQGLYIVAFLGTQGEWERSADVAKTLGDYVYASLGR